MNLRAAQGRRGTTRNPVSPTEVQSATRHQLHSRTVPQQSPRSQVHTFQLPAHSQAPRIPAD